MFFLEKYKQSFSHNKNDDKEIKTKQNKMLLMELT